jgi:pilus assembly protein CpaE
MFSSGLRKGDIEQVLGDSFACCIPNNYGLVREAIDRGVPLDEIKPGNPITNQIKKLVLPHPEAKPAGEGGLKKFKLSWAR